MYIQLPKVQGENRIVLQKHEVVNRLLLQVNLHGSLPLTRATECPCICGSLASESISRCQGATDCISKDELLSVLDKMSWQRRPSFCDCRTHDCLLATNKQ